MHTVVALRAANWSITAFKPWDFISLYKKFLQITFQFFSISFVPHYFVVRHSCLTFFLDIFIYDSLEQLAGLPHSPTLAIFVRSGMAESVQGAFITWTDLLSHFTTDLLPFWVVHSINSSTNINIISYLWGAGSMPERTHFSKRQALQNFLVATFISHFPSFGHINSTSLR